MNIIQSFFNKRITPQNLNYRGGTYLHLYFGYQLHIVVYFSSVITLHYACCFMVMKQLFTS